MEHVEAQQRGLPDLVAAQQQVARLRPEDREVRDDARPDRDRPERELVPRQQVAGEGEGEREQQQQHADDPVELARRLVGAGEEDPAHVQEDDRDHAVRGPAVRVAQEHPERDRVLEVLHAAVRRGRVRDVVQHQREAGDRQAHEQEEADEAEAERVRGAQDAAPAPASGARAGRGSRASPRAAAASSAASRCGTPTGRRAAARVHRRSSCLEPELRADRATGVDDQLAAARQAQREARERPRRRALPHAAVLEERAAVARAREALAALLVVDVAAEVRADGRDGVEAVGAC